MITIVLAEKSQEARHVLRALLEAQSDFQVVAETSDAAVAPHLIDRHRPNVFVTDLTLPSGGGLELTRQVREQHPAIHVVVLVDAGQRNLEAALASGAVGYVEKNASGAHLVEAVRHAARGERYTSPLPAEANPAPRRSESASSADPEDALTPRERQVLRLAAQGRTNAQMGVQLGISPRTIEVHRANLMRKLRLRSRTELVRYALKRGILPLD